MPLSSFSLSYRIILLNGKDTAMSHYIEYTEKDEVFFKLATLRHLGLFDESVLTCAESYVNRYFALQEEGNTGNDISVQTLLYDMEQLEILPQILVKGLLFDPYMKRCTLL